MEEVCYWSTYEMPIPMESPRLSSPIIMEEVGWWLTYKMPVPMESPRWTHHHAGGRLLVDILDTHTLGEFKIELCHHHGGGWMLVDW